MIGVDTTNEMMNKTREDAAKIGAAKAEFRSRDLDHVPVADNTGDAVMSSCVINLVPDKARPR